MQFQPLSLLELFDRKSVDPLFIYPFSLISVFEMLYWLALAWLLSGVIEKPIGNSLKTVVSSYGIGLLLWVFICNVFNCKSHLMKKLLKYLVGIVLLTVVSLLVVRTYQSYKTKKESGAKIQTLQHCSFESLNGGQTWIDGFNPDQPTVIIYFHPECEHCQYEASEIGKEAERFAKANMILITSDDSTKRVEAFAIKYRLWEVDNLAILIDRKISLKISSAHQSSHRFLFMVQTKTD